MIAGKVRASVGLKIDTADLPAGAVMRSRFNFSDGQVQSLAYGTGSGFFDVVVATRKTLAALASATYDLTADFIDNENRTASFSAVKLALVWVDAGGDTSGVRIGGAGSNPWGANFADTSDMALIYPGGFPWSMSSPAGVAVTSTAKNLKVENLGAVAVTLAVYIAGSRTGSGMAFGLPGMTYP